MHRPVACSRRIGAVAGLVLLLFHPLSAADDAPAPLQVAADFARGVLQGSGEIAARMTDQLRAAMTPEQTAQLPAALAAQHGEFQGTGDAWLEDRVAGFDRYRVPLRFARETVDMRVVMDASNKIAGLFVVAHVPRPDPAARPPAGDDGEIEEVDAQVGTPALPGTISRPAGAGPFPAVVLIHGSGPNDRDGTLGPNKPLRDLAWGLARQGVLVLRYDKRSYARPADLAALGEALTVREEVLDDARAALDLLRSRDDTDKQRIFVLGHSLGGTLVPRVAGTEPRPAGIIALAGSTLPLPEKMLEQTRYILAQRGDRSAAATKHLEQLEAAVTRTRKALDGTGPAPTDANLGAPIGYFRDLEAHDPPALAAALGLPALILQGRRDYQVTLRDFERWKSALSGRPGACLTVYDDLDHLFHSGTGPSTPADYDLPAAVAPKVIRDIATFIKSGACPA